MDKKWSTKWISSTQPRKQRKYRFNAPLHIKRKFLSAKLETKLCEQIGKKTMSIKKDDEVIVKRGKYKSKMGKVVALQIDKSTIHIEKIKEKKGNGQEFMVPIHASNLQIIKLNLSDARRTDKSAKRKKKTDQKKPKKIQAQEIKKTKTPDKKNKKITKKNQTEKKEKQNKS